MEFETIKLNTRRGATLNAKFPVKDNETPFSGRVSAYVRERPSSKDILATLDARYVDNSIEITLPASRSSKLPCGQFLYFVEIINGVNRQIERNYLSVEP